MEFGTITQVIVINLIAFMVLYKGINHFRHEDEKEYQRNYKRQHRAKAKITRHQTIREWQRATPLIINDYLSNTREVIYK